MNEYNELIDVLSKIPGIGKKSATRISFFMLKNKNTALEIADKIKEILDKIKICTICGDYTIIVPCLICKSNTRDKSLLCIIEDAGDLQAIEETGLYHGLYHVLMGTINPLEGIHPENLRINELLKRIEENNFKEILIATNPTTDGEATFLYLTQLLNKFNVKISRLATGIPMGGSLEYSDKLTLIKALQSKYYLK